MKHEEFTAHPLWKMLRDVGSKISKIDELGDSEVSALLEELRLVRAYNESLGETDQTFLVTPQLLDELNNAWKQVSTGLNNYIQNPTGHRSHLDNARNGYLDQARNVLLRFPRPEESSAKKAASTRAATAYVKQIDEARHLLEVQIESLKKEREDLLSVHQKSVDELTTSIESLRSEAKALSSRISDDENRISTALTESNEAFNKSQTDRQERFSKWLEQQEDAFLEEARPQHENIMAASESASKALSEVEALRTSVVDMANLALRV